MFDTNQFLFQYRIKEAGTEKTKGIKVKRIVTEVKKIDTKIVIETIDIRIVMRKRETRRTDIRTEKGSEKVDTSQAEAGYVRMIVVSDRLNKHITLHCSDSPPMLNILSVFLFPC